MYDVPESSRPFHKINFIKSFKSKSIIKAKIDHFIHDNIEEYGYLSFKINEFTLLLNNFKKIPLTSYVTIKKKRSQINYFILALNQSDSIDG